MPLKQAERRCAVICQFYDFSAAPK